MHRLLNLLFANTYMPVTNRRASKRLFTYALLCPVIFISACQSQYQADEHSLIALPKTWQENIDIDDNTLAWSQLIASPELTALIKTALADNRELRQKELDVSITKARLYQSKMRYVPELDASFSANRRASDSNPVSPDNQFNLSANLSYELDIWGKVSEQKASAAYAYAAALADYESAQRRLVLNVSNAWALLLENQQVVVLAQKRLVNLNKNLSIIEGGYRSGLNNALSVYLARNEVKFEQSRLVKAEQTLADSKRELTSLLGYYPNTNIAAPELFPVTSLLLPPSLPSELLMRKPELKAAWLTVLQNNAELAIAHKSRFPSLRLTASTGQSSDELSTLFNGNPSWSIGASLLQPILASGRLKANEDIARFRLEQTEATYTSTVYNAFQVLESELQKQRTLEEQYHFTLESRDNALQAEKLSFEQYLKGLVSYTTVLDSQRRAVDAEVNLISLKRQIFTNKIQLHNALAGELDFIENDIPQ